MAAAARARTARREVEQLVFNTSELQYQERTLKEQIERHMVAQQQRFGQAQAQWDDGQAVAEPPGADLTVFGLRQKLAQLRAQLEVNHSGLQAAFSTAEARTAELLGKHAYWLSVACKPP